MKNHNFPSLSITSPKVLGTRKKWSQSIPDSFCVLKHVTWAFSNDQNFFSPFSLLSGIQKSPKRVLDGRCSYTKKNPSIFLTKTVKNQSEKKCAPNSLKIRFLETRAFATGMFFEKMLDSSVGLMGIFFPPKKPLWELLRMFFAKNDAVKRSK